MSLFSPIQIGPLHCPNRVVLPPMTRMRAPGPGDVPNDLMKEYYVQRASAGLSITEGAQISLQGKGCMDTPGIHSPEQVEGWRDITGAVHEAGGRIGIQLWHVGRVSHEKVLGGELPVSASALPHRNRTTLRDADGHAERVNCPTPRALETEEVAGVVEDFAHATRNAKEAGFDFVEIHAAHGYLLPQFMSATSNERTDQYGGSLENRARLTLEVLDATIGAWSADRVGLRISPLGTANGLDDADGAEMGLYIAREAFARGILYLHISEPDWFGGPELDDDYRKSLREAFPGTIIGAGKYDLEKAERLLAAGYIDAAAFGRIYIANPDLPERLAGGHELNEPNPATFYDIGANGYTDYPALEPAAS